ncbi:MAG: hypothetical protein HOZ81_10385 [Streptomyces sp.]|nr:hypothetical protein [Streptomyces sp.]
MADHDWICWFCAAGNHGSARRCGFCLHHLDDGPDALPRGFIPAPSDGFTEHAGLLVAELGDGDELIAFGVATLTERRALAAFSSYCRSIDPMLHRDLRLELSDPIGRRVSVTSTLFFSRDPALHNGSEWLAVRSEDGLPAAWLM